MARFGGVGGEYAPQNLQTRLRNKLHKTLWYPTARIRLIQYLFHTYGVDEVAKAIKAKQQPQVQK